MKTGYYFCEKGSNNWVLLENARTLDEAKKQVYCGYGSGTIGFPDRYNRGSFHFLISVDYSKDGKIQWVNLRGDSQFAENLPWGEKQVEQLSEMEELILLCLKSKDEKIRCLAEKLKFDDFFLEFLRNKSNGCDKE